ncbi:primase-helicase family protein [Pseudomonas putida]|uniref:Uncharacterized protein n=1 Tax=Pseudomonas putida TaxID=303 RepID=A0A8I1EKF5_PSEPU|nr:primase-helicase family protein [Pseudomonas putida]MBI6887206.1 hypothetical protein [Pseudomonas putida]
MSVTLSHGSTAATADVTGRLCLDELYRQLAANEPAMGADAPVPAGVIKFGVDVADFLKPSHVREPYTPTLQIADDNGSWLNHSKAAQDEMRAKAKSDARVQAESERYAGVQYGEVEEITDESWALIHLFNNDFAWHSVEAKALELATGHLFTLAGLVPHIDKHYGPICGYDKDGKPCKSHLAARWWKQPSSGGKRAVSSVEMNPTSKPDDPEDEVFNSYHLRKLGMAVPDMTATREDIAIVDDHLLYQAGGCHATREYLLDWTAYLLQNPDFKPNTAPIFVSPRKGVGKTWFAHLLHYILGPELFRFTAGSELWSSYDDVFIDTWGVWLDEMPDPRSMLRSVDATAKLKRLTTSHKSTLRPMFAPSRTMRVPAIIMTLNKMEAIAGFAEGDDRRYCFVVCPDEPRSPAYYNELFAYSGDMKDNKPGYGVAKFYGYMLKRDLSKFDPNAEPPQTGARALVREVCLTAEAAFIKELIEEGAAPFDRDMGRVTGLLNQIEKLYGDKGVLKGMRFTSRSLPSALREIGAKQLGVDGRLKNNASTRMAWCWRNFNEWDKKPASAYSIHIDKGTPPAELEDDHD